MGRHVKIALNVVLVGALAILAAKFLLPIFNDYTQTDTSDARATKGKITIGYDNWVGYFQLCSPEMKKRLRQSGYLLECIDDNANYADRFKKLSDGKYDFAVGTVDSYITNGEAEDYPGVIVAVIDESKGGDAVVAWKDSIKNLDDLKSDKPFKVAFTPDSPSSHLLKAISVHFDIPNLRNRRGWSEETNGSSEALKKLLNKEVEVAVLWEPDVSKALQQDGVTRIIGTEDTKQLIVDVLIANRSFSSKKPEVVNTVLDHYFRTLKYYRDNPEKLVADLTDELKIDKDTVNTMLSGVNWASLTDNVERWYGVTSSSIPEEALIDTIESSVDILMEHGSIKRNPIPNGDPYRITNSSFVKRLFERSDKSFGFQGGDSKSIPTNSVTIDFAALSDRNWDLLREVGTLKIRPIVFASGTSTITSEGKTQIDSMVESLKHYPRYRLEVRGHTGLRGDSALNKALSSDRADAVKQFLSASYSIDKDRIRSIGYGGERPLPKLNGESNRAYNYRLPRVELVLVAEEI